LSRGENDLLKESWCHFIYYTVVDLTTESELDICCISLCCIWSHFLHLSQDCSFL